MTLPEPTHDADRDISAPTEAQASYDLASNEDRPNVIATNPMRRAGHGAAVKEEDSLIGHTRDAVVVARSGNQGWDEDGFEAVGGVEEPGTPDIPCLGAEDTPEVPLVKGIIVGAVIVGLYMLFTQPKYR